MAKTVGYYVLLHEDHPAIMEIMSDEEYARMKKVDPDFVMIKHVASKGEAMDIIMDKLRLAYLKDPTLQTAKAVIRQSL